MKNRIHVLLLAFTAMFLFAGCEKGPEDPEEEKIVKGISAKWDLSGTSTSYQSIELNESLTYILVESSVASSKSSATQGAVIFGTYEVVNATTLKLNGFGTLSFPEIGTQSMTMTLNPTGGTGQTFTATKVSQTIPSSNRAEMLCKTWQLNKIEFFGFTAQEKEELEKEVEGRDQTVLFSMAGTYFVKENTTDEGELAKWKWKNQELTQFYYTWDDDWEDGTYVEINKLTQTQLEIKEYYRDDNSNTNETKYLIFKMTPYKGVKTSNPSNVGQNTPSTLKNVFGRGK